MKEKKINKAEISFSDTYEITQYRDLDGFVHFNDFNGHLYHDIHDTINEKGDSITYEIIGVKDINRVLELVKNIVGKIHINYVSEEAIITYFIISIDNDNDNCLKLVFNRSVIKFIDEHGNHYEDINNEENPPKHTPKPTPKHTPKPANDNPEICTLKVKIFSKVHGIDLTYETKFMDINSLKKYTKKIVSNIDRVLNNELACLHLGKPDEYSHIIPSKILKSSKIDIFTY